MRIEIGYLCYINKIFKKIILDIKTDIKLMRNLFTILLALLVCNAFGQIAIGSSDAPMQSIEIGGGEVYKRLSFPSQNENIDDFIKKNLKYPEEAKAPKKEGYFLVFFAMDKEGKIIDYLFMPVYG